VLSQTQSLLERQDDSRAMLLCDIFCVGAGLRFRAARTALAGGADGLLDEARRDVAAEVRTDGGYALPDSILDVAPTSVVPQAVP
jgi:hypothetical protein